MRLTVSGEWPGPLTLRQGWSKASARPWNDRVPDAAIRMIRGGSGFAGACARQLQSLGAHGVTSPPLAGGARRMWQKAGFEPYLRLHMYRRTLTGPIDPIELPVRIASHPDWRRLAEVDGAAFDELWRMDELGLREAHGATPSATVLFLADGPVVIGFAVVGLGSTTGYLQRIAVEPAHRGIGNGRALVRASLEWARKRGALNMLLNTQPDNTGAAGLYRSEGFQRLTEGLEVLRYQ